ncbi:MAG: hypothetical protein ACE15C_06915 [Phycisphaerae bacterium]
MTTEAQRIANRNNSLKSTGPVSPEGKAAVAGNATKHGIRAKCNILPDEDIDEWLAHLDRVMCDLAPEGHVERQQADYIAMLWWRLGRVARCEKRSIVLSQDIREVDAVKEDIGEDAARALRHRTIAGADEALRAATTRIESLRRLVELPDGEAMREGAWIISAAIEETHLRSAVFPAVLAKLPDWPGEDRLWEAKWTAGMVRRVLKSIAGYWRRSPEALIQAILSRALKDQSDIRQERQLMDRAVDRCRQLALLPPERQMGTLLRYETSIQRLIDRATKEFHRLQAVRRKAAVAVAVDQAGEEPAKEGA